MKKLTTLLLSLVFIANSSSLALANTDRLEHLETISKRIEKYLSKRCQGERAETRRCLSLERRLIRQQRMISRLSRKRVYTITESNPESHLRTGTFEAPILTVEHNTALETLREQIIDITNAERAKEGLAPLRHNSSLEKAAQIHSDDMQAQDYFNHNSQDGRKPLDRITTAGYLVPFFECNCSKSYSTGENIAKGQDTAAFAMQTWMDSPGHRANILSPDFDEIGIGISKITDANEGNWIGYYWVQNFGKISLEK